MQEAAKTKKILFVISRMEKPSSRLRVLQYLPFLKAKGYQAKVIELKKSLFRRLFFLLGSFFCDIVFIQKKLMSGWELALLRRSGARLVFDFDDAIIYREQGETAVIDSNAERKFEAVVSNADMVIAGNGYLAEMARKKSGKGSRVLSTPCPADPGKAQRPGPAKAGSLVWIGSKSTLKYLKSLEKVFAALSGRHPQLVLYVISDHFDEIRGIRTVNLPWKLETEFADIAKGDIGLMPLYDNEWCRGKCGFKIIQYMACGIPTVASAVGFNNELITDGENGFLARSDKDWIEKISALLSDPSMFEKMRGRSREAFEKKHTLEGHAEKIAGFLGEL
jgi:glycosyltransferase involved in cell wall biosynthesis